MSTLGWIVGSSLLMSAIALVGSLTLVLPPQTLDRISLPLVAFAAGSLIGGALLHNAFFLTGIGLMAVIGAAQ